MSFLSEISDQTKKLYDNLEGVQGEWYKNSRFTCPSGCGCCCHDFEPDLMECEAVFMAEWLVNNKPEIAQNIAEGNFSFDYPSFSEKTCIFFNPDTVYHCSIYGGRPFICRLFGASSTKDKGGNIVWRACKFYPLKKLQQYNKILDHKTYSKSEAEKIFGTLPPVMSDVMEQAVSIVPDSIETFPLREILPKIIGKVLFEKQFEEN